MATEAIVSVVLEQLISITARKAQQEVRLVMGVKKEIEKLTSNFRAIQAVLVDAEQRQVKDKVVADWLHELNDVSYDMDDVLDEWNTAILKLQIEGVSKKKVCFCIALPQFFFKQVALRCHICFKIKEINERLDSIATEKDRYNLKMVTSSEEPERLKTTSFVDVSKILGRDIEKNILLSKLLSESSGEEKNLPVISIVGMGGIGKTTLAQFAYNDKAIKNNFHKKIWVCVSDPFDEIRIAKAIIEGFTEKAPELVELQTLLKHIQDCVVETKFLLILDDVWTEDNNKWEPLYNALNNGLHGSKILVTTRKTRVAHMMESTDIINIEELSNDASWLLFKQLAFSGRSPQECELLFKIGREIVGKCKGLPLAIKTIGSLLRFKKTTEQWERILDNELWELKELEEVFRPLLLSYNDLPSKVKQYFLYCAIYPKNYDIEKDELIKLWMAQGYLGLKQNEDLELIGEDYFENLAMRSFFQEFKNDKDDNIIGCKMHDIVHDFALFLVKNDCCAVEIDDSHAILNLNRSHEKTSHLMLKVKNKAFLGLNKLDIQKLRSLLLRFRHGGFSLMPKPVLLQSKLFERLTCLRSLEISSHMPVFPASLLSIVNIPKKIGKLIHLRHLLLTGLDIRELPDSLCDLFNLQTLDLSDCMFLKNLPQGMGKLVNLRHLILDDTASLEYLPKGVERLTNLRTLSRLVVGGGSQSQACGLDGLKNLNHLRGKLELEWVSNDLVEGEAKNARLKDKKYIVGLTLLLTKSEKDEAVLEALEAPPCLKKLEIHHYGGIAFPKWIVSLTHLKRILLVEALECECLPALGKLPLLESLDIREMSLKSMGNEFLGVEDSSSSASSSSSSAVIAFPKLKYLEINSMEEWEEWEYENTKDIIIMPSLSELTIWWCPKLKALPDHLLHSTSLHTLRIVMCSLLKNWCQTKGIRFTDRW